MPVVFDFRYGRCTLADAAASELARRLREDAGGDGPGLVVATRIELALEVAGDELRLLDSEANALTWTIARWLEEVGADEIPHRVMELRYALDREGRVEIRYGTESWLLPRSQATVLGDNLRVKAAGGSDEYGVEGARQVADAIEDVLVGRADGPVRLDVAGAESVFYVLNTSIGDPRTPLVAEAYSLYTAIRNRRLEQGHSSPP